MKKGEFFISSYQSFIMRISGSDSLEGGILLSILGTVTFSLKLTNSVMFSHVSPGFAL